MFNETYKPHTSSNATPTPGRVALVSPFTNATNSYIELHKSLLRALGFEVKPLSVRSLLHGAWKDLGRADTLVLFHWLETRAFLRRGAGVKLSLGGFCQFIAYVALMRLSRARTVYFVHNHGIHDAAAWQTSISRRLIAMAAESARVRVVHDPARCAELNARYLPHPIYWDTPIARTVQGRMITQREAAVFGILGAMRPYKGIDEVISVWPNGHKLVVRGKAEQEYLQHLQRLLQLRDARNVVLEEGFLSPSEFDAALDELDVLIIPQIPGSMLVSGAFFEGIGRVGAIIARKSTFVSWASQRLPGVFEFESLTELPEVIERVERYLATADTSAAERAKSLFGWDVCLAAYRELFGAQ